MDPLAIPTSLLAAVVILSRAPLIFAPAATLRVYRRLIENVTGLRALAALLALLGVSFAATAGPARDEHGGVAMALEAFGWLLVAGAAFIGIAPRLYQGLARSVLEAVTDEPALRVLGVLGVVVGLGFGWAAIALL